MPRQLIHQTQPSQTPAVRRKGNYAFIDSQNLNLGVRSQGWNLSFERFRKYLKDKYHVTKAFLFIGYIPENQGMYASLQKTGYIVVFKPTLIYKHKMAKGVVKGNVDAELVLHAMIEYKNYHKAVIVSGDGDFHCLVEYLADSQKLEKIIVPNKLYSSLLRKYSRFIVNVGILKKKLAYESQITESEGQRKKESKKSISSVRRSHVSSLRRQKN